MASEIRVNKITHTAGVGTITTSADGIVVAGIVTANNFTGSGANLTSLPAGQLTGTLPAISGANLTSLPSQATIANNADNRLITGGSGVNLNGEANLTFSSNQLTVHEAKLKGNQLLFTTSGTAYLDHSTVGQDIQVRVSTSSSNDTTGPTFKSNGNLAFASGKGIDFSATSDASGMASELFDDYEEGLFTPSLDAPNQSGTTFVHFHNYGYYTKIGNVVTVAVYIQGYASGNASGGSNDDVKIIGLPFAPAVLPGSGSSNRHNANWTFGTTYKVEVDRLEGYTYGGNTYIDLLVPSNGTTGTMLKSNQINQNTCQLWCEATYRV